MNDDLAMVAGAAPEPETETEALRARVKELRRQLDEAETQKGAAYRERNILVCFLTRLYPSGRRPTEIEGWDPEWNGCVYVDTPEGQLSWHYHTEDRGLFDELREYEKEWDGHTTTEKYLRLLRLRPKLMTEGAAAFIDELKEQGVLT